VIDDEEIKKKLAYEMGKAWLSDMLANGVPKYKAEEMVKQESWDRIARSPIVVIACLTMEDMHKYPDLRRKRAEYVMGVQSVVAYIQTMLLVAYHYNLGACWICAPLFCKNIVRKVLDLPRKLEPQAMIIMGYADEEPLPPPRKPLDEICVFNIWSKQSRKKNC
jgi:F420 biosynthesis protein FbiB-like protein